jgi:hypothetical protein
MDDHEKIARKLATLHQVKVDILYSTAVPGAFIQCTHNVCTPSSSVRLRHGPSRPESTVPDESPPEPLNFFIAAGLGKQQLHDQTILFLSPAAPLAKALYQRRTGDSFLFNGRTRIQDIF